MSLKTKWTLISILTYVIFVILAVTTGILNPARIGIAWSVSWYIIAAAIVYYLWFKNIIFEQVMTKARKLGLSKNDLAKMLPKLKKNQEIPDPKKRHFFSPIFNFSLQNLDILNKKLSQDTNKNNSKQ